MRCVTGIFYAPNEAKDMAVLQPRDEAVMYSSVQ